MNRFPSASYGHSLLPSRGVGWHGFSTWIEGGGNPFAARIFSVIDIYDALVSDHPYRKALPMEEGGEMIKNDSRTHFDPRVVDALLAMEAWLV